MIEPKPDLRIVDINSLKKGMYVVAIANQKGKASVAKPGRITAAKQLQVLKNKGIINVTVDWSQSAVEEVPEPTQAEAGRRAAVPETRSSTKESDQRAAKRLFDEAKTLQSKYFKQLQHGQSINLQPMERAAEGLINSLESQSNALLCLAKIRAKDKYLMEHSLNVGMLLAYFGRFLGMNKNQQKQLLMGGMLHDIGKINTPDEVLQKPGKLTDEEFVIMRQHVVHSYQILKAQEGVSTIMLDIARNHHERLDGKGYPNQLKGDQLSETTRMANIVDCYDALTADRVYKSGVPPTAAFRILLASVNSQFDKILVEKFIRCMGVYPVGTTVRLKSGRLGVVVQRNSDKPLKPVVKVIFNTLTNTHTEVRLLDLSKYSHDLIEAAVSPRDYGLSIDNYLVD
ncbi:HD-GYP domain-containing protein [Agarivorans sp.]|uniref:HD-GYP domain-containing protein n=1 Tax=Agarivorans sp. TaxID=1872412 RepID=UPI003D0487ED